ncbi:MAG: right-handed parallel beta-helix repeat-containing protein [Chitinivibrionia bacterium]|nr:right-handed parallel beta-helix repeat-containing protein [Chitinivibrionia bacterium]
MEIIPGSHFTGPEEDEYFTYTYKYGVYTTQDHSASWRGNVFALGDVVVGAGRQLAVTPETKVLIWPDDLSGEGADTSRIELNIEGYLDINGAAENPVVFQSWQSNGRDDWIGIKLWTGSSGGDLDHVIIKNAETGIKHNVPVTLTNSTISDCEIGIESDDNLTLSSSTVTACTDYGVHVRKGTATLSTDTISFCDQNGIGVYPYYGALEAALDAASCFVHDNEVGGIAAGGSYAAVGVQYSKIENNYYGITLGADCDILLEHCMIKNNDTGVLVGFVTTQATGWVKYCTIRDNATNGIWMSDTDIVVWDNIIDNNDIGINCDGQNTNPFVYLNDITDYGMGIKCDHEATGLFIYNLIQSTGIVTGVGAANGANPDLGHASESGYNSFKQKKGYYVCNLTEGLTIMAEDNYWPYGQAANRFIGFVDRDPYLDSIPNLVAPMDEQDSREEIAPDSYALKHSYPNPFNPFTIISYEVPPSGDLVSISIYNAVGQVVKSLLSERKGSGYYSVDWDGRDSNGQPVASGVYFVQMRAGAFKETRKILLLK